MVPPPTFVRPGTSRVRRRPSGFTLIELMIVLAILGVLASVAIAALGRFRLRSTTAEAMTNLAAIRTAENSYFSEFSSYVSAAASPPDPVDSGRRPFSDSTGGFETLGWRPLGSVYFRYAIAVDGASFTADASADLDADGLAQVWGYAEPAPDGTITPGLLLCDGVWDAATSTPTLAKTVGPCGPAHGRSIF